MYNKHFSLKQDTTLFCPTITQLIHTQLLIFALAIQLNLTEIWLLFLADAFIQSDTQKDNKYQGISMHSNPLCMGLHFLVKQCSPDSGLC